MKSLLMFLSSRMVALCVVCVVLASSALAQQLVPVDSTHAFIRYDSNYFKLDPMSVPMRHFFKKWDRVVGEGKGEINIIHIGGSHVQAGVMSHRIRRNILLAHPDRVGGRGMVFPYSAAAKCNNPADYRIHCKEKVILTRCVYKEPEHRMGVAGIAVTAHDSATTVQMILNEPEIDFASTKVVVIGESPEGVVPYIKAPVGTFDSYRLYKDAEVGYVTLKPVSVDTASRRFLFRLPQPVDSFDIVIPCQTNQSFTLQGVVLDNDNSGITFHSIGVNGAAVPDYLKCSHFVKDLQLLKPDMVIFGIGINDASGSDFDTVEFKNNYLKLIDSIKVVNPECAFVFITNNDSYKRIKSRTYVVNPNGVAARDVFYRLAKATGGAVWDQFEIMGGLRSMDKWRLAKLAKYDRVHFTHSGYKLIGDLFYNALAQTIYDNSILRNVDHKHALPQQTIDTNERYRYISY